MSPTQVRRCASSLPSARPQIAVDPLPVIVRTSERTHMFVRTLAVSALLASQTAATLPIIGAQDTSAPGQHGGISAASSGRFGPPINPVNILRPFDAPQPDWLPGHRGIDLQAPSGAVVQAPALGVVSFSGQVVDRPVVTIDHGRVRTTYEPAIATVPVGHVVVAGEPFATVGSGGHCADTCVHWGALIGERYIDPMWLIDGYTPVLKTPR